MASSAGSKFRQLITSGHPNGSGNLPYMPLQLLGAINPYCALLAQRRGAKALYISGSGVATASYGLPDLGITSLDCVLEDVRRVTSVTQLPVLVDVDTGFGGAFGIARTVREMERAGAAAIHIEDQVASKRCGHRPGKQIVSTNEMIDRIKAAVNARMDPNFVIMARTDALANEGLEGAIKRCRAYVDAGADMLFPEAFTKLEEYSALHEALPNVPLLANITEFGKTPLYNTKQLGRVGVSMVLYPLSAHRAMAKAADNVYKHIVDNGCQDGVIDQMQTRKDLYNVLNYHQYEDTLNSLYYDNEDDESKKQ